MTAPAGPSAASTHGDRVAVRHDPRGRGHAYRPSLDQRLPHQPVADEPVLVGALTSPGVERLAVEVEHGGDVRVVAAERTPLVVDEPTGGDHDDADGHLAAAAAAGERIGDATAWSARLPDHPAGAVVRYRFVADGAPTDWYRCTFAGWSPQGGELAVDGAPQDRLAPDSVSWLLVDGHSARVRFALHLDEAEHIVGLGERFHAVDQRGWAVDTKVFEQYKGQGRRTYLPVPFALVVGRGVGRTWGFHVATTRRCWFDVGASDPTRIWIEVACDPERPEPVRLELYEGTPAQVLDRFWDRAGRPVPAPQWVLRPWMSSNEWNTQERVVAEVSRTLQEGIPAGVLVIEAWADEATFTAFRDAEYEPNPDGAPHRLADFTFPEDGAWPDPVGMVRWLHDNDVRVLLWQIPLLPDGPDVEQLHLDRAALVERGFALREPDGSPYRNRGWWFPGALMPDLTDADARRWWTAKRRYLVDEVGIDGFKTDGGEHAWGDDLVYADGTRGDVSNDRFPNLYAAAYHDLLRSAGVEGITFSRAGSTGAGVTPCHWAGDEDSTWEAYQAAIRAGLTAGVSGIVYWGWDHGGFSGEIPDAELYLRTAAMACFCPIMQYHAEFNHHRAPNRDRTPWNIAERTGDARVVPIYRRFAVLRDRLVTELDAQVRRGIDRGLPLMRPLCLEWPDDPAVWQHPETYLLGDDLLVAPVTAPGAEQQSIYVPGGRWIDPWAAATHPSVDGPVAVVQGPTVVEVAAPLERIPVLVRESAAPRLVPLFVDLPG